MSLTFRGNPRSDRWRRAGGASSRSIPDQSGAGALVNYDALYAAVAGGRLGGVGLDVYWEEPIAPDDPLLRFPNVIATPHIAGVTDRSYAEIADVVVENVERLRRGEPPLNRNA